MEERQLGFYLNSESGMRCEGCNCTHRAPRALLFVRCQKHLHEGKRHSNQKTGIKFRAAHVKLPLSRGGPKLRVAPVEVVAALAVVQEHLLVAAPRMLRALQQKALEFGKAIGKYVGV